MKELWREWKKIVKKIISVEASIVFGVLYIIAIIPLSFILKTINPTIFFGGSYHKRESTYWNKIPKRKIDLNFARKQ